MQKKKKNFLRSAFLLALILFSCSNDPRAASKLYGHSKGDTLIIAFLGDSRSDGEEGSDGLNKRVLSKLLSKIKLYEPDAVFFTGDLTLGIEKESEIKDSGTVRAAPPSWGAEGFIYDNKEFKRMLGVFSSILESKLGAEIPFYPLMGNHEAVGPDAVSIFKQHFSIKFTAPVDSMHLAYTVEIGPCLFVILATDYYDIESEKLVEHKLSGRQKKWLTTELKNSKDKFTFTFVLAHEPAYSVSAFRKSKARGLDKYLQARDDFWKILTQQNVTAYFCSHEHLYHRSQHNGVWQVISGGGGAPLEKGFSDAFYHFLILTIPPGPSAVPKVTVIDINDEVRDEFELK